jgi:TonB family protein
MATSASIIEIPKAPTYGAVELKEFINKNTIRGFIITIGIVLLFLLINWIMMVTKPRVEIKIAPKINITELTAAQEAKDQVEEVAPPPTAQVINYGMEARAGTPVPIPDANIKQDLAEFADVKDIQRAMSTTGTVDITKVPDLNIEDLNKPKEFTKEVIPSADEFIPVEKDPQVDLNELKKIVVYPEMAKKAGIEGKVLIRVYVQKNGKPLKTIIQQSDSQMLNQAAVDAVMKSVFTPGIQNGQPIGCWVTIPIVFSLKSR